MPRTLVHSHLYTSQLQSLGDLRRLDEALTGVEWALATNPEIYPVVDGTNVRLLKTDLLGGLPVFRIWFEISDDGQVVSLLYIEPIPGAA